MTKPNPPLIGGKTIEDWDRGWVPVEGGPTVYHPHLRHKVGLYRMMLGREVMAIGAGTDKDGGLAKRLSDFRRPNASARSHHAGQHIHQHLDELRVEVLITGADNEAREIALQLKTPMIRRHRPAWTVPNAPFMRKE
jgi:hypothetical protein